VLGIYYLQQQVNKEQELQGKISLAKDENQEISRLLHEKELLIASLLKVNKTVETGALSASIAHELNQPLGASSINIEFLQQKLAQNKLSPESTQEILGQLASDNLRASNIIKSLRGFFARDTAITSQHDINALIQNVLSFTKPELAAHQIKVNLELAPEVSAPINSSEIQQVLVNLLNNSINAITTQNTPRNGLITIQSASTDQEIRITIFDNGPGISDERKDQLFDLFSGATKSGMGLGLWLCHHIITRHNGKIWHENMLTQGARFIIILPKAA
jgi:signal transduction histidine kinase